jgi:hypothetical protein
MNGRKVCQLVVCYISKTSVLMSVYYFVECIVSKVVVKLRK